ncbi:hypothetical protein KFU94_29855 [Chloroflexi bacterium TSY]|nr:hypothetical protein [Chloroflexi bacterium TSY]
MNTEQKYTITWSSAWIGLIIALILPYIIMGASIFFGAQVLSARIEAIAQDVEQEIARLEVKFDGIVADVEKELTPVTAAIDEVVKDVDKEIATVEKFIAGIEADVDRVEKTVDGIIAGIEQELVAVEKEAENAIKGFVHEVNVELTKAEAYGQQVAVRFSYKINADEQSLAAEVNQMVKELDIAYAHADADTQKEWNTLKAEYDQVVKSLQSGTDATAIDTALNQLETLVETSLKAEGKTVPLNVEKVAKEIGLDEKAVEQAIDSIVNTVELDLHKAEAGGRLARLSRSKFGVFGDFQSRLQGFWSHLFRFRLQKTTYFISENRQNLTQKLDIDRQICIYVNCLARILSQNLKFGSTESDGIRRRRQRS